MPDETSPEVVPATEPTPEASDTELAAPPPAADSEDAAPVVEPSDEDASGEAVGHVDEESPPSTPTLPPPQPDPPSAPSVDVSEAPILPSELPAAPELAASEDQELALVAATNPAVAAIQALAKEYGKTFKEVVADGDDLADGDSVSPLSEDAILAALRAKYAAAALPPPPPQGALVVLHGSYQGPGCPDASDRKRPADRGYGYDEHHPAQPGELIVGLAAADARRLVKTKSFKAAS